MASRNPVNDRSISETLITNSSESEDAPKLTYTTATGHAPAGRVFEDSLRGTLFWEIDHMVKRQDNPTAETEIGTDCRLGGRPFGIQWLSQARVPFSRTRGLRNPWNGNKEVKIARDGIELEHDVGKRLVSLFHV